MPSDSALDLTMLSDREIRYTRTFDAPISMVFDALTKPELLQQWFLGPGDWTLPICEIDLRVGGEFRYVWRSGTDGTEIDMRGEFTEIEKPGRLVSTERFVVSWYPGEGLNTTILTEEDGKTKLTTTLLYESKEARDIVLQASMESGVVASFDRLDDMLARR